MGGGTAINWPVGLGGKGNEGVAGLVQQTKNSIGYVELIYAVQNKMSYGSVQNQAAQFVKADLASVRGAAIKLPPRTCRRIIWVSITNAAGEKSYPDLHLFMWLLIFARKSAREKGKIIKDFIPWMPHGRARPWLPDLSYDAARECVKTMIKNSIKVIQ